MSQPQGAGRIAIKLGSGPTNKSSGSSRPVPPSSLGKRSRPQPWGNDDDDDSESDDRNHGAHEKITGFGELGAESEERRKKSEKKEYVIARQPNRDWKADARGTKKGRQSSPPGAVRQQNGNRVDVETEPADQDKGIKWGLTITKKDKPEEEDASDAEQPSQATAKVASKSPKSPPPALRTADEEAMDALLGKKPKQDDLVIPSASITEDSAYQAAIAEAGEASTLADYEAMPVEEFGAALLRGMGWDGKDRAPARKPVVRRPNRLGLGAKELKDAEDLGAWDQGKNKRGGGRDKRPPKLSDYRREEEKRKERRGGEDSYKRERERERERDRDRDRGSDRRERDYGGDRHRYRERDHDRHHRR